jgi:hypothetical protein
VCKEVGLEVNPEKTKYMLVSRCQKAGQRQSIKIGNMSFESVVKFKRLGTTLTDQNWEDQGFGGKMGSEWMLGRLAWGVWIGFDCLRTVTSGGLL